MQINENAPAIARAQLDIAAEVATVWQLLTAFERWPTWNPDIKSITIDGPVAPGTRFQWQAGPGTIKSILQVVEPLHLVAWTGKTMGIHAIHVYRLEAKAGATHVYSEESWDGLIVRILRGPLQRMLQDSLATGLEYLKRAAETSGMAGP